MGCSNNLRVLELPDFVLEHVERGALHVSVAREFLVLQNADHCHEEDMRAVIKAIANSYGVQYRGELPNWSRKNVRSKISEQVAVNESDFRPLGPKGDSYSHYQAGAAREATFDTEAFAAERPDTLHTIPNGDASRVWTCDVREWRRRQTQATREANQAAEVSGTKSKSAASAAPSRDKQFEASPWPTIPSSRRSSPVEPGRAPHRPVNDEERAALGTRAELQDVTYETKFWKVLDANSRNSHDPYRWEEAQGRTRASLVPRPGGVLQLHHRRSLRQVQQVPSAREHHPRVFQQGALPAEATRRGRRPTGSGSSRSGGRSTGCTTDAALRITRELDTVSDESCYALAATLLAAQPAIQLDHPDGEPHKKWSYETSSVATLRRMLGGTNPNFERYGRGNYGAFVPDPDLGAISEEYIRELVAALMVHHLHQGGQSGHRFPGKRSPPPMWIQWRCGDSWAFSRNRQRWPHERRPRIGRPLCWSLRKI